jgi:hypothetical protein
VSAPVAGTFGRGYKQGDPVQTGGVHGEPHPQPPRHHWSERCAQELAVPSGPKATDPAAIEAFERVFNEAERTEIAAIVDLFTFNNRFNNTWEGWLPGASRRRARLGLCDRTSGDPEKGT